MAWFFVATLSGLVNVITENTICSKTLSDMLAVAELKYKRFVGELMSGFCFKHLCARSASIAARTNAMKSSSATPLPSGAFMLLAVNKIETLNLILDRLDRIQNSLVQISASQKLISFTLSFALS